MKLRAKFATVSRPRPFPLYWNNLSLRAKGLLVIAVPLAAMFGAGGFFLLAQRSEVQAERWVQHTLEVKSEIAYIRMLLADGLAGNAAICLAATIGSWQRTDGRRPIGSSHDRFDCSGQRQSQAN